jgi:hypothetical protein
VLSRQVLYRNSHSTSPFIIIIIIIIIGIGIGIFEMVSILSSAGFEL